MSHARYLVGDVFERMAELPDASVDLVLTSPPFLALRSYLPADHPDKAKEIGSEPTPAAFLDTLLHLTAEWRRVLAPHGSICVELGDTYSGSGGAGGDYAEGGLRADQPKFRAGTARWDGRPEGQVRTTTSDPVSYPARARNGWPMDKSLCGIPHLYHLSLAYGRNLLTGEPSPAGQWRVRNVVAWCRPNPPVGALGDKFRPGTSYMTIATVARDRYFDLDAVRMPLSEHSQRYYMADSEHWQKIQQTKATRKQTADRADGGFQQSAPVNPAGAPPLDWWEIPTQPYPGSHYATWPAALCTKPIRSMCPQRVCTACGEPSRRIVEPTEEYANRPNAGRDFLGSEHDRGQGKSAPAPFRAGSDPSRAGRQVNTVGWTDCGCHPPRGTTVLRISGARELSAEDRRAGQPPREHTWLRAFLLAQRRSPRPLRRERHHPRRGHG